MTTNHPTPETAAYTPWPGTLRSTQPAAQARPEPEDWVTAEIREAVGEIARGYSDELTEHWRRLEMLASAVETLEARLAALAGGAQ